MPMLHRHRHENGPSRIRFSKLLHAHFCLWNSRAQRRRLRPRCPSKRTNPVQNNGTSGVAVLQDAVEHVQFLSTWKNVWGPQNSAYPATRMLAEQHCLIEPHSFMAEPSPTRSSANETAAVGNHPDLEFADWKGKYRPHAVRAISRKQTFVCLSQLAYKRLEQTVDQRYVFT